MKIYYVYIVQCKDESFYTGITNNLDRRVEEHNAGTDPGVYTYNKTPVVLKWYEGFTDPVQAIQWEKKIKGWSRRKKMALISENWEDLVLFSKNYAQYGNKIRKE